jgi:hypothetical protein
VVAGEVVQDQGILVDRQVLMLWPGAVEGAQRVIRDAAERCEPGTESVAEGPNIGFSWW